MPKPTSKINFKKSKDSKGNKSKSSIAKNQTFQKLLQNQNLKIKIPKKKHQKKI